MNMKSPKHNLVAKERILLVGMYALLSFCANESFGQEGVSNPAPSKPIYSEKLINYGDFILELSISEALEGNKNLPEYGLDQLGPMDEGSVVEGKVLLRNDTDEVLRASRVAFSCDCIGATASSDEILPGEHLSIDLKFKSAGKSGNVRKYIFVTLSNNEKDDELEITIPIDAEVRSNLRLDRSRIDIVTRKGERSCAELRIVQAGAEDIFHVYDVKTESGLVDVEFVDAGFNNEGRVSVIRVCSEGGRELGLYSDTLLFLTTIPSLRKVELPIRVDIVSGFEFRPRTIYFGLLDSSSIRAEGHVERRVAVKHLDGKKFRLDLVSDDGFQESGVVISTSTDESEGLITVRVPAAVWADRKELIGDLTFQTGLENEPTISIALFAMRK